MVLLVFIRTILQIEGYIHMQRTMTGEESLEAGLKLLDQGNAFVAQNNFDAGIKAYTKALKQLDPTITQWKGSGWFKYSDDITIAFAYYHYAYAYFLRGQAHRLNNNHDEALQDFNKARYYFNESRALRAGNPPEELATLHCYVNGLIYSYSQEDDAYALALVLKYYIHAKKYRVGLSQRNLTDIDVTIATILKTITTGNLDEISKDDLYNVIITTLSPQEQIPVLKNCVDKNHVLGKYILKGYFKHDVLKKIYNDLARLDPSFMPFGYTKDDAAKLQNNFLFVEKVDPQEYLKKENKTFKANSFNQFL
jgi:tetratricopeptide (TPR) repeat protein